MSRRTIVSDRPCAGLMVPPPDVSAGFADPDGSVPGQALAFHCRTYGPSAVAGRARVGDLGRAGRAGAPRCDASRRAGDAQAGTRLRRSGRSTGKDRDADLRERVARSVRIVDRHGADRRGAADRREEVRVHQLPEEVRAHRHRAAGRSLRAGRAGRPHVPHARSERRRRAAVAARVRGGAERSSEPRRGPRSSDPSRRARSSPPCA